MIHSPTENIRFAATLLRRAGALLCLCAVLFSSGIYSFGIQAYGWYRMYDAYSETLPASEALALTFSGDELCGICVLSEDSRQDLDDNLAFVHKSENHTPLSLPLESLLSPTPSTSEASPPGKSPLPFLTATPPSIEPPPPRLA